MTAERMIVEDLASAYAELAAAIERLSGEDGRHPTIVDGLFFGRRSTPSEPLHLAQQPCFALVVQGAKSLTLGKRVFDYGVGDCLLVALDLPVVSQVTAASVEEPHLGLGFLINPHRLQQVLDRTGPPRRMVDDPDLCGVAVERASADVLDVLVRMVRLADRPDDVPLLAPLLEQELLYRLLMGPFGGRLMRIAPAAAPGSQIGRAIAWLQANYDQPVRLADLADHVGMSLSGLHHRFKAATAMTPLQYVKRLRLHEARRLMLMDRMDAGSAAFNVGYQSPSQFSREYSRLYGRPPLRDIGLVRAGPDTTVAA